ncbi:DUF1624 domain-containing protein [Kordiimonas sp. SCSIO 12603]|uniref:DUF1624 domain-containing protein n=1 Tax=Kordiimonas sp. SCSIO 12603 TaxID=2829596 RepID=UPI002105578B|nr:heparan-alpha-glucosaminide N-acetyltransferase domain-containing protein [Kordiimonas sp. SCSIO 12603]UTW57288.1 DUF1624 domain-containing protein [Kordiimonas sp. SCSIO 12603]
MTGIKSERLQSIDFLRGLVMIIMALDHTRDYFNIINFDPTDYTRGDTWLFLTRWITHFCAPVFVLLAGTSIGLMEATKSKVDICKFLITRGLWLIFVEMVIITFGWAFNFNFITMQVIAVLGFSMLVMAVLIWLPRWFIAAFGIVIVFGHNALDYGIFPTSGMGSPAPLWHALHNPIFTMDFGWPTYIAYPALPWIGVMPLGYILARIYEPNTDAAWRRSFLIKLGVGITFFFIALRATNLYGDPTLWKQEETWVHTLLSFINGQKYPPSLLYLAMTLGPALIVLSYAEKWRGWLYHATVILGRVPFFFYVLHIYLIHVAAMALAEFQGIGWKALAGGFWAAPSNYGLPLWGAWLVWIGIVAALYPACKWFAGVKARRKDWWLSYL